MINLYWENWVNNFFGVKISYKRDILNPKMTNFRSWKDIQGPKSKKNNIFVPRFDRNRAQVSNASPAND